MLFLIVFKLKLCFSLIYFKMFKHNIINTVDDCKKQWKILKTRTIKKEEAENWALGQLREKNLRNGY